MREVWLAASRSVFSWAARHKHIGKNPFADVKVDLPRRSRSRETKAFKAEEIRLILRASTAYKRPRTARERARRWVMWLCAYLCLEVRCLGCDTHQTVALDVVRRPKTTPIHELKRYMRCKDCSQVRGYAFKRSHLVAGGNGRFRPAIRRLLGGRGRGEEAMSMIRKLAVWSTIAALSFSVHARAFDVRRVVTGIDADNKSNAILDSKITLAPAPNDLKWAHLWVNGQSISATDTGTNLLASRHPRTAHNSV